MRTRTADAAWVGNVGQWVHRQTKSCLSDPTLEDQTWNNPEAARLFTEAADKLFKMFPVLLLMAAARKSVQTDQPGPDFVFSDLLRNFLTTTKGAHGSPLLDILQSAIEGGRKIQEQWRAAMNKWQFPRAQLDPWRAALREREATLLAFQRALQPLRRDIRLRPATSSPPSPPAT